MRWADESRSRKKTAGLETGGFQDLVWFAYALATPAPVAGEKSKYQK